MHRSLALVAFLALSWSHLAGLRCDMGVGALAMGEGRADATGDAGTPSHGHHPNPTAATLPTPHPTDHGSDHGCLMIMACGFASVRQARPATMIRIPAVFFTAAFPTPPIPVAADLAVETPPPRHTV